MIEALRRATAGLHVDWSLVAVIALALVSFGFQLDSYPRSWVDESWEATAAHTTLTEGIPRYPIGGSEQGLREHLVQPRLVLHLLLAAAYSVFGVSLAASRGVVALTSVAAVVVLYTGVRRLTGDRLLATIISLLLTIDSVMFVVARTVRPEAIVVAAEITYGVLLAAATIRQKRLYWFAAGIAGGIGAWAHPLFWLVLPSSALAVLVVARRTLTRATLTSLAIGFFIGLLPYASYLVVIEAPHAFTHFTAQMSRGTHSVFTFSFLVTTWIDELQRYDTYLMFPYRLPIVLVNAAALFYALRSREVWPRALAIFTLTLIVLFPLLIEKRASRYLAILIPPITVLSGWFLVAIARTLRGLAVGFRQRRARLTLLIAPLVACLYVGNQAAANGWALWTYRSSSYNDVISQLRQTIPPGSRVWGSMSFWIGMADYPYATQYMEFERILAFDPQYVILGDADMWGNRLGIVGTVRQEPDLNAGLIAIRSTITEHAERYGSLVKRIENTFYGDLDIYRIDHRNESESESTVPHKQ